MASMNVPAMNAGFEANRANPGKRRVTFILLPEATPAAMRFNGGAQHPHMDANMAGTAKNSSEMGVKRCNFLA